MLLGSLLMQFRLLKGRARQPLGKGSEHIGTDADADADASVWLEEKDCSFR